MDQSEGQSVEFQILFFLYLRDELEQQRLNLYSSLTLYYAQFLVEVGLILFFLFYACREKQRPESEVLEVSIPFFFGSLMQDFVYIFAEFLCVTALRIQASSLSLSRSAKAELSKVVLTHVYLYLYSFYCWFMHQNVAFIPKEYFSIGRFI